MSTIFYKQVFSQPADYLKARSQKGGSVKARKSILDPKQQKPVFMSSIQATRPSFTLRDNGYVAIRGKEQFPEDEGKDKVQIV